MAGFYPARAIGNCEFARTNAETDAPRRGGRPCPPGGMHPQNSTRHRRPHTTSVGVDAALSPHAARPFLRYVTANLQLLIGRTEASAPTKRFSYSPMVRAILRLHSAGSICASTPTDILPCRRLVVRACWCVLRGRGKPLPYANLAVVCKRSKAGEASLSRLFTALQTALHRVLKATPPALWKAPQRRRSAKAGSRPRRASAQAARR